MRVLIQDSRFSSVSMVNGFTLMTVSTHVTLWVFIGGSENQLRGFGKGLAHRPVAMFKLFARAAWAGLVATGFAEIKWRAIFIGLR